MAKAKTYYAVKKGLTPGVYYTWADCQQNVNGYPGAIFKKFTNEAEAKAFLEGEEGSESIKDETPRIYSESEAVAYVDGSYNMETGEYSYGAAILYDGGEERFSAKFNDSEMAKMNNVAGEIEGAKAAMKFCVDNGIKSLDLFYDYEGIEKWCTGAWTAKKPGTKEYRKFYNQVSKAVKINFMKVKAHSGNEYNDIADNLAKSALGLGDVANSIKMRDNGVVANGIRLDDLKSVIELVGEDFNDLVTDEREIPYGHQYIISISSPNKQKLTISYYESKQKIWLSGRKEDLFNRFTLYIIELLEIDEIPVFLNTIHELTIDKDVVQSEFEQLFPNSHDKIPADLNNYLHQAVYNMHISGEVYAANFLVEPALRPLEGILKLALVNNGLPIRKEGNNHDSFFIFKEGSNGRYILKKEFIEEKHSQELISYLCKCYTYFHKNRHTLFHWDNPAEENDTTRILNTVEEASVIIRDCISLIDEYFTI